MTKRLVRLVKEDRGSAVAEYAVVTVAACAFGALLVGMLGSGWAKGGLTGIFAKALFKAFGG